MAHYRLGKAPARPRAVKFRLTDYFDLGTLPTIPRAFGHEAKVGDWGMLGNDQYGDCVWAGAAHETLLWNAANGRAVDFTDEAVLSDYSAVTGFNPADPDSDQGTDMAQAASYRRRRGVVDANGNRHTVGAYLAIDPKHVPTLKAAAYIFGAVGLGIQFPDSAMDQFNKGKVWRVTPGSTIEGGHYVPVVGASSAYVHVVTWGKVQRATNAFVQTYADEAFVYVSAEDLTNGRTPEGFDVATLQRDLAALR